MSQMIEKIAVSKNPAEATAAMVAALAASSRLGNQRKLLLELTKKVDEQKKLLEKKRKESSITLPGSGVGSLSSLSPTISASPTYTAVSSSIPSVSSPVLSMATTASAAAVVETPVVLTTPPVVVATPVSTLSTEITEKVAIVVKQNIPSGFKSTLMPVSEVKPESQAFDLKSPATVTASVATVSMATPVSSSGDVVVSSVKPEVQTHNAGKISIKIETKLPIEKTDSASGDKSHSEQSDTKTDTMTSEDQPGDLISFNILKHLQEEVSGKTGKPSNEQKETVPNPSQPITKNISSNPEKMDVGAASVLKSLFSSISTGALPGLGGSGKTDQRKSQTDQSKESSVEFLSEREKQEKKTLSKTFLGFDYDSDSSGGSFDGFDDDELKKLSPRKRKLVERTMGTPTRDEPPSEDFGDTDIRIKPTDWPKMTEKEVEELELPQEDVDLRQPARPIADVDERQTNKPSHSLPPGHAIPTIGQHPSHLSDVDHRRLPFMGPPGIPPGLPHIGLNQPPPPGEDWQPGQPAPPPLPPPQVRQAPPLPPQPPLPVRQHPDADLDMREQADKTSSIDKPAEPGPPEEKTENKKEKKGKKKDPKSAPLMSDQHLNQIVMQIASREPIDPPPLPPILSSGSMNVGMPPSGPPVTMGMPGPPMGMMQQGMGPPVSNMGPSGMGPMNTSIGPQHLRGIDGSMSQASMVPPNLPPHLQPGVGPGPPMPHGAPPPQMHPMPPGPHPHMGPPHLGPGPVDTDIRPGREEVDHQELGYEEEQSYPPPLIPGLVGAPLRGRGRGRDHDFREDERRGWGRGRDMGKRSRDDEHYDRSRSRDSYRSDDRRSHDRYRDSERGRGDRHRHRRDKHR